MNKIMAHRGWSSRAPENTLAAIQLAVDTDWISSMEIDVQLSKDGVPVIIHDFRVDRTTNGSGFVKDLTWQELSELDAGSWFSSKYRGEKIPTLEEVLHLCKGEKQVNIELKAAGDMYIGMEEIVLKLVKSLQMEKEVVITSFDHERIKRVQSIAPELETGLIIEGNPFLLHEQLEYSKANIISMSFWFLTKAFVQKHLELGRRIVVWTPNTKEEIAFVKQMSENIEICTNYPERVKQLS